MIRLLGFIPSPDLFIIETKCHDKLDDKIHRVTASCLWQSKKSEPHTVPGYDWMHELIMPGRRMRKVAYQAGRSTIPFSIPVACELITKVGGRELPVQTITFTLPHFRDVTTGPAYAHFTNVRPTLGSEVYAIAEKAQDRYFKKRAIPMKDKREPRILELSSVEIIGGEDLDEFVKSTDRFMGWLSRQLAGLLTATEVTEGRRTFFKHHNVRLYDSVWTEEVKELGT